MLEKAAPIGKPGFDQERLLADRRTQLGRADWLCPLKSTSGRKGFLNLELDEYLAFLEWTGRQIRSDKPGSISHHLEPILASHGNQPGSLARHGATLSGLLTSGKLW